MPEHRFCQYRKCGVAIDRMKATAKYCSPDHKAAEHRARDADPSGTTYPVGKPYVAVRRASQRAKRRRRGTAIYTIPEELAEVRPISGASRYTVPESIGLKLGRAKRRLERAS